MRLFEAGDEKRDIDQRKGPRPARFIIRSSPTQPLSPSSSPSHISLTRTTQLSLPTSLSQPSASNQRKNSPIHPPSPIPIQHLQRSDKDGFGQTTNFHPRHLVATDPRGPFARRIHQLVLKPVVEGHSVATAKVHVLFSFHIRYCSLLGRSLKAHWHQQSTPCSLCITF
jgi:hypothetical protein